MNTRLAAEAAPTVERELETDTLATVLKYALCILRSHYQAIVLAADTPAARLRSSSETAL